MRCRRAGDEARFDSGEQISCIIQDPAAMQPRSMEAILWKKSFLISRRASMHACTSLAYPQPFTEAEDNRPALIRWLSIQDTSEKGTYVPYAKLTTDSKILSSTSGRLLEILYFSLSTPGNQGGRGSIPRLISLTRNYLRRRLAYAIDGICANESILIPPMQERHSLCHAFN